MSKVANVGKLAGHTLFISGASRGIGLEVAKKAAADGANIVVAAKTATVSKIFEKISEKNFFRLIQNCPVLFIQPLTKSKKLAVKPSHWLLIFVTKRMSRMLLPLL